MRPSLGWTVLSKAAPRQQGTAVQGGGAVVPPRPASLVRLDRPRAHLIVDVFRLADLQCNDRQGRVAGPGARELTAVADKQILDVVGLTPAVANAVGGLGAHPH